MVAWRSNRAEARKAVAVRAARDTKARTLISAKLGEDEKERGWRGFILVAGHVDPKLVGAGEFLDVGGVHPTGVRNFLGLVLRINSYLCLNFAPRVVAQVSSRNTLIVEAIGYFVGQSLSVAILSVIKSNSEVAGVARKDVIFGWVRLKEKIGGAEVGDCGKPRAEVAHGV
jgi:hypothetical protein